MPTPQLNIRVPTEHHKLMKNVAAKLRQDKGFAKALTAFVADVAPTVSAVAGDSIASILTRLESVEAQLAELRQSPASKSTKPATPNTNSPPAHKRAPPTKLTPELKAELTVKALKFQAEAWLSARLPIGLAYPMAPSAIC